VRQHISEVSGRQRDFHPVEAAIGTVAELSAAKNPELSRVRRADARLPYQEWNALAGAPGFPSILRNVGGPVGEEYDVRGVVGINNDIAGVHVLAKIPRRENLSPGETPIGGKVEGRLP
jgi:hypothetical protein